MGPGGLVVREPSLGASEALRPAPRDARAPRPLGDAGPLHLPHGELTSYHPLPGAPGVESFPPNPECRDRIVPGFFHQKEILPSDSVDECGGGEISQTQRDTCRVIPRTRGACSSHTRTRSGLPGARGQRCPPRASAGARTAVLACAQEVTGILRAGGRALGGDGRADGLGCGDVLTVYAYQPIPCVR